MQEPFICFIPSFSQSFQLIMLILLKTDFNIKIFSSDENEIIETQM